MGDSISISDRAKKRYNSNFSCRTLDVRLAEHITHLIFSPLCTSRITVLCERKREQRGITGSRFGGPASWERSRLLDPAKEGPHGGSAEPPTMAPSLWRKGAPRGGCAQPAATASPDGPRPGRADWRGIVEGERGKKRWRSPAWIHRRRQVRRSRTADSGSHQGRSGRRGGAARHGHRGRRGAKAWRAEPCCRSWKMLPDPAESAGKGRVEPTCRRRILPGQEREEGGQDQPADGDTRVSSS